MAIVGTRLCERCNRKASDMEVGWGRCTTCGRLLCPADITRGCDGVVPAALLPETTTAALSTPTGVE
jgi:hypothetical protein